MRSSVRITRTGQLDPLNGTRKNALPLVGLIVVVSLGLGALGYWYLSPAAVTTVDNKLETSAPPPGKAIRVPPRDATSNNASDHQGPSGESNGQLTAASSPISQYDRRPEGYVGTAECASCHVERHQSYLRTHHSRSLREVDPNDETQGRTLVHQPSQRSYDVIAKDGGLWHREWRHFSGAPQDKILTGELPVSHVMGSGAFAKGYLLSDGDYLLQSPVTWYAGSDDLEMAPGYDGANHYGFTRVVSVECMFCHAGLLSTRHSNPNHLAIHELSIGCERCHGPGEAHSRLYREIQAGEVDPPSSDFEPLIVHPGKLDRRRAESICGQCHLHGDIEVTPPGGQISDFVAGEDFAATLLLYKHDQPGDFNGSFTGHFDQMWQSKCYLQSDTLTCITCHDSHQAEPVADRTSWRRQQCHQCHSDDQQCGVPLDERIQRADNDCIQCHMPSLSTSIPHTSTTSHLIAIYEAGKPLGIPSPDTKPLRRLQVAAAISDTLLSRSDSVAKAMWAVDSAKKGEFELLLTGGLDEQLDKLLSNSPDDADVHSLLTQINWLRADRLVESATDASGVDVDKAWAEVVDHASLTLQLETRPVEAHQAAVAALGNEQMEHGDYAAAALSFSELTQIRRMATDWYNLGLCFGKLQRFAEAERAFREAIRLDGTYAAPYRSLSVLYRTINPTASQQCESIAQRLMSQ